MGKRRNPLDESLDRTRQRYSRRLMKALREGRLNDELKKLDREGKAAMKEHSNGRANGKPARNRRRRKRS